MEARAFVSGFAETLLLTTERKEVGDRLLAELAEPVNEGLEAEGLLRRFCLIARVLTSDGALDGIGRARMNQLRDEAAAILEYAGVPPRDGSLSFLHLEIERYAAALRAHDGRPAAALAALWQGRTGCPGAPSDLITAIGLEMAQYALRAGHASIALECLSQDADTVPEALLLKIDALRATGDFDSARDALSGALPALPDDVRGFLKAALLTQETGDVEPLVRHAAHLDARLQAPLVLEAILWLVASRKRLSRSLLPKAETIRRKFRKRRHASDGDGAGPSPAAYDPWLIDTVESFENAYDNARPLGQRIEQVFAVAYGHDHARSPITQLLALAAAVRFFARHNQHDAARLTFAEYRRVGLALTAGIAIDPLGVFGDEIDPYTRSLAPAAVDDETHAAKAPPESSLARGLALGRLSVGMAATVVNWRVRRAVARKSEQERMHGEEMRQLGERLVKTFGDLRGLYAKLGQSLSYLDLGLPEPLRVAMTPLQTDLPTVAASVIARVIEEELGAKPEDLFELWDPTPIASASIGQVHWAKLKSGEEVAVKVQIPGVAAALQADLSRLFVFRGWARRLIPETDVDALLTNVRTMFVRELDYLLEADECEAFRAIALPLDDIVVPRVHRKYSTARVLTCDFLRGTKLVEFASSADAAAKDKVGAAIYRLTEVGIWSSGRLNADPHPGNFIVLPDGRCGCIDFGCSTLLPAERQEVWRDLIRAMILNDVPAFKEAWHSPELFSRVSTIDAEQARATLGQIFPHLVATGPYRFDQEPTGGRLDASHMNGPFAKNLAFPDSSVSSLRGSMGMLALLRLLGAGADFRALTLAAMGDSGGTRK